MEITNLTAILAVLGIVAVYLKIYHRRPVPMRSKKLWDFQKNLHKMKVNPALNEMFKREVEEDAFQTRTKIRAKGKRMLALVALNKTDPENFPWHVLADWQDQLKLQNDCIAFAKAPISYWLSWLGFGFAVTQQLLGFLLWVSMQNIASRDLKLTYFIVGLAFLFSGFCTLIMTPRPLVYKTLRLRLPLYVESVIQNEG